MRTVHLLIPALVLACSTGHGAVRAELGTASFHVGSMSCVSCEKSIRKNLAGMKDVELVLASAEAKRVRLRFDVGKVSMQEILATIRGKEGKYEARLALKYSAPKVSSAQANKAQAALAKVPGVRAASLPDDKGVVLITFRPQPPTFLPSILKAASDVGAPLHDLEPIGTKPTH